MQSKKRFTETNLWDTVWFSNLAPKQKLFWYYVNDKCDNIGIWEPNIALVGFYLKIESPECFVQDFFKSINKDEDRIIILENGKWFITNFVKFQYVKDKPLNPKNPAHRSYLRQIRESGMTNWFQKNEPGIFPESEIRGLEDLSKSNKDKDKDKDMDKEEDKDQVKGNDIDSDTAGNSFYCSPVIPEDIGESEELDDETVNELNSIYKYTDVAERIISVWPNISEMSSFPELLECENILKEFVKNGSAVIDAERFLKDELRSIRRDDSEIELIEALTAISNQNKARYKSAC